MLFWKTTGWNHTKKVFFSFWQEQSNQLNAKTVHRTIFCQKCFTLLNFVVQVLLLLYKKRKNTKKGVLSFWQGLYNQLNAKTVPRTVFCQKCFTLLNFVVQVLLLLYKKEKNTKKGVLSFWQGQKDLASASASPCVLMARRPLLRNSTRLTALR